MSENLSSSPQIEIKETPVNQSLELANEFFNALGEEDKEIFSLEFETPEAFSEELGKLSLEQQQEFLKLLKTNPEITTEIANLDNIIDTEILKLIDRYNQAIISTNTQEVATNTQEVATKEAEFIKFSDEIFSSLDTSKLTDLPKWQETAKNELLRTNPELAGDPQKLESYANAYVLLQHSESILQTQPDLADKVKQLQVMASGIDIFKNIESKKEAELIDESFGKSDVLKRDLQQAKASLLPDGQELKIDGKILTSGDQKLTFGDNGPKKEISRHGYSIDTTVQFSPDYKFKYESQNMRQLYQKTVADYKTAEANLKEVEGKVKEIDEKIAKADDDLLKDAYKAEKEQLMQTEVVSFQQQFDKQRQTLLEVYDQANAIDTEEKQRIPEYQNLQEQKDAQARETLDFLNNMGLTYIPQDTFEQLLTRINKNPQMYGFPREITLESGLGGTLADKKAIKEGFYNLFTKLYEKIGVDLKGITVDKFINGTAGDQFKNQTFDTLLENPGGFKTKGTFNSATFIDFMLAPKEGSEAKQ